MTILRFKAESSMTKICTRKSEKREEGEGEGGGEG